MNTNKQRILTHIVSELQSLGLDGVLIDIAHSLFDNMMSNFTTSGDTNSSLWQIEKKVSESAKLLGMEKSDFVKCAQKQSQLFYQSPTTLNKNVEESVELLGMEKSDFVKCAQKQPQLLCQSPETLNKNVEESARLLGMEKKEFVKCAQKQSPLFCQSPETLNKNVEESAVLLGLEKDDFVRCAQKQPPLFYQSPDTVAEKVSCIVRLAERGVFVFEGEGNVRDNTLAWLLQNPLYMCLSIDNLMLRFWGVKLQELPGSKRHLTKTRKSFEAKLIANLLGRADYGKVLVGDASTWGERALTRLIKHGYVKSMKLG